MAQRKLTYGTDVEVGLYHRKSGGIIPASSYNTPPEKGEPGDVSMDSKKVGTYHRDNILLEYQTPICDSLPQMIESSKTILTLLEQHYMEEFGVAMSATPAYLFTKEMVAIPEAQEAGCDPDLDAYAAGEEQPTADPKKMGLWRAGSGHIHIGGIEDYDLEAKCRLVRWLDALVGLRQAYYEIYYHSTPWVRRMFYGQAGRFRDKPYGLEWRTPSNSWVASTIGVDVSRILAQRGVKGPCSAITNCIPSAIAFTDRGLAPEAYGDTAAVASSINAADFLEGCGDALIEEDGTVRDDQSYYDGELYTLHMDELKQNMNTWESLRATV